MAPDGSAAYEALIDRLRDDDGVLGVMLTGSQARAGMATEHSDHDVLIVVDDDQLERFTRESRRDPVMDVRAMGLTEFRTHALPAGSEFAWARYSFTHSQVVVDTEDGLVQRLVLEKGTLGEQEAVALAPRLLDQFINSIYRSLKNDRDGNALAARMDAAEAVRPMIGYLCALDPRIEPYNKYLEWELERFPLPVPGWDLDTVRLMINALLDPADVAAGARRSFAAVEATAVRAGHGDVVEEWGEDLRLMRGGAGPA